jgi:hypothetical protein
MSNKFYLDLELHTQRNTNIRPYWGSDWLALSRILASVQHHKQMA